MRFKEFIAKDKPKPKLVVICHYYDRDDVAAVEVVRQYLVEGGTTKDLGKGRMVVFHRAHTPVNQDHLHFLLKNNELYSLNKDGTAHDGSHGKQLHRWAMDTIRNEYPNFKVPPKGLIESNVLSVDSRFLVEARLGGQPLVPESVLTMVLNHATLDGAT